MKLRYLFGIVATILLMQPHQSQALALPSITDSVYLTSYGSNYFSGPNAPASISASVGSIDPINHPGTATGILNLLVKPFPSISAFATATGGGGANVGGTLDYYFTIVGPADTFIPTIVKFNGDASVTQIGSNFGASSHFSIAGTDFADAYDVSVGAFNSSLHTVGGFATPFSGSSYADTGPYSIRANSFLHVRMSVTAVVFGDGTASAFIDPFIMIDPNFADRGLYSIILSEGISNDVSAVPIPAALPLFGTALLGLGGIRLRAKRKAVSATS